MVKLICNGCKHWGTAERSDLTKFHYCSKFPYADSKERKTWCGGKYKVTKNRNMKAEKLMIGDWVLTLDSTHKEKVFAQVDAIEEGKRSILVTRECSNWFVDIDWIEPVPLISGILEKNGFVLKEEEVGAYGVNIASYYTRDDVPFEVFCDGEPFAIWFKDPVNIGYVHELQHALRLCRIEKELVIIW